MFTTRVFSKLLRAMPPLLLIAATGLVSGRATTEPNNKPIVQNQPENRYRQLVRVFVHRDGVYPDVIRVRPGRVFIRAENETEQEVSLVVERLRPGQGPDRAAQLKTANLAKRADQELSLGVGEYEFYEESRPTYRGKLIVEPR